MSVEWHGDAFRALAYKHVQDGVNRAALTLQREVSRTLNRKRTKRGGQSPASPGEPPANLTGQLSRSIEIRLARPASQQASTARVFTKLVYAAIHEFGGTIVPRVAKALAIPIGLAGARAATRAGASLTTLDLDLIPRRGKPPLLVRKHGNRWEILFVLLKMVRLPARPYFRPSIKAAEPKMREWILAGVDRAIRELESKA